MYDKAYVHSRRKRKRKNLITHSKDLKVERRHLNNSKTSDITINWQYNTCMLNVNEILTYTFIYKHILSNSDIHIQIIWQIYKAICIKPYDITKVLN